VQPEWEVPDWDQEFDESIEALEQQVEELAILVSWLRLLVLSFLGADRPVR
jgi:hypothetical protein